MEEDLLKERLQAITEKRRVQEEIRRRKQELDREKLKLQHLKKKALREQWLLDGSATHNGSQQQQSQLAAQHQIRALQNNIYRIEKEVESLERTESVISTNEGLILKRLKAVEKSPMEIIKEARENFTPEPIQVAKKIPDPPLGSFWPPANAHKEPNAARETLFAMEINVTRNLLTGESKVVSTAAVNPQELNQCKGVKVYDDGRKCIYALEAQKESREQGCVPDLSPKEVEQLLRDATQHHHKNIQNQSRGEPRQRQNNHWDKKDHHRNHGEGHRHGNSHLRDNHGEKDHCYQNSPNRNWHVKQGEERHYDDRERRYSGKKERNDHNNQWNGHHQRNQRVEGHSNGEDLHYNPHWERKCHSRQDESSQCGQRQSCHVVEGGGRRTQEARANGCPPLTLHDQELVSPGRPELCYTPATHIPLSDYISVEEEELYLSSPPSYRSFSQSENGLNRDSQSTALFYRPTLSARASSPLYEADAPYTILSAMETTEPITAVFLGFQTAQDESGYAQDYEGSLKAELVIIDDNDEENGTAEEKSHTQLGVSGHPAGLSANGAMSLTVTGEDRRTKSQVGPGIRKIRKKHKACCSVC